MGGLRRAMFGAVAGGIVGGAMSDSNTGTGTFQSVALGAMAGAGIGAATSRGLWTNARKGAPLRQQLAGPFRSPVAQGVGATARLGYGAAKAGVRGAGGVARFAMNNPRTALLGAGGAAGIYALSGTGPGASGMNAAEMEAIAVAHGGPSTGFAPGMGGSRQQHSRAMFAESTFGLTQGLHKGRHR